MNESLPPRNHNVPPSDIEYLGENLTLRHVTLIRKAEEHVEFVKRIPDHFHSQMEADFTSDFIKRVQVCFKDLEKCRAEEKEPFLRQGQFVDTFFRDYKDKLQATEKKALSPLNEWLHEQARAEKARREEEANDLRREREAAIRAAADIDRATMTGQEVTETIDHAIIMTEVVKVADAVAAAPLVSMASSRGEYSAAGLQKVWRGEVRDVSQLDMHKLRAHFTLPELQKALNRFVKSGGRQCEGAAITEEIETKVK